MFNLFIILHSTINSEPKDSNNYKIAKYIIENIEILGNCSLADLAKKCYVSNSSISRFCRDIGLSDFNELRNQMAIYSIEHEQAKNKFNYKDFDKNSITQTYIHSVIDNLKHMCTNLLDQNIQELAKDIFQYKEVAAFGYMQSENVALNLQFDLQTNNKVIYTCIKFIDQIEYIKNANNNTLIIIFSESGTYFNRVFARTKPFKNLKNKPKIYLITSNFSISLPYIDRYIHYQCRHDYASHPYPLLIIANLISIYYAQLIE